MPITLRRKRNRFSFLDTVKFKNSHKQTTVKAKKSKVSVTGLANVQKITEATNTTPVSVLCINVFIGLVIG